MKHTTYIYWEQAAQYFEQNRKEDIQECKRLIEEIESSDFTVLDANDVNYYANRLNELSDRKDEKGKPMPYTANEVRRINMNANDLHSFDMLNTFVDDITDDVIGFY